MSVGGGGGNPALVGYIVNNLTGARDDGGLDFTAAAPFATDGVDSAPLTMSADANPILGTTVTLTTSNETTNPSIGVTFLSFVPLNNNPLPPVDLTALLGAPECFANIGSIECTFNGSFRSS